MQLNSISLSRRRINDYPAVFWAAVIATVVGGWMSVHAYHAMMHSDDALVRSIGIFITLECVSIFAAATLNTRGQGLLVGMAFVLIVGCAGTEIFLGASELQRGIMQMTETAKAASASTANGTANAGALATAQAGLKGCQARYPRKQKDAQVRADCSKPYEKSITALTAGEPAKAVAFNPEAAGMLALWQGITDAYNAMMGKEGDTAAKVEQVAFVVMVSIFTVFVVGKLFLWSKYASWVAMHHGEHDRLVTVEESQLGSPDATHEPANTSETPTRKPFGFSPAQTQSETVAKRQSFGFIPSSQETVNTGNCNQETVNTGNCNQETVNTGNSVNTTAYAFVQFAKVGQSVHCPICGRNFVKANKWHLFCSNNRKPRPDGGNCSDDYHNTLNPNRADYLKNKRRGK